MVTGTRNLGFAAGANAGIEKVQRDFVLLINPDTTIDSEAPAILAELLNSVPKAAAVGPLVLNPDGTVQPSKRLFPNLWQAAMHAVLGPFWPSNPGSRKYLLSDVDLPGPMRVGWVAGSAMLLRVSAFLSVGGFDDDFFFFMEDVDLCKRLSADWEIWFEPRAQVVHAWGTTWRRHPLRFIGHHQLSVMKYVRKHFRGPWVLAYPAIALGLAARFVLLLLRSRVARNVVPAHKGGAI